MLGDSKPVLNDKVTLALQAREAFSAHRQTLAYQRLELKPSKRTGKRILDVSKNEKFGCKRSYR